MKRDIGALADREFDLVVVGAGVYGAAIAWEGVLRGLSVALIDKGDFGSGTSFNNLKTVHGGLRYLQHADFRRMRESVRERRNLMRIAPHLVHPLPFLVPTYRGSLKKSLTALRVALALSEVVSRDTEKHLPAGRALSRDECLKLAPGLVRDGLTGGVLWHDAQMHNSDRLTLSFVQSAAERGAVVANFVEAVELLRRENRVQGVVTRGGLAVRGRLVVNAAGPWVDRVAKLGRPTAPLFRFSKAMNLVTRRVVDGVALGVTGGARGRFLCLIPWRDVSLVGTSHAPYDGGPDELEATEDDIEQLLSDLNDAYPEARLRRDDVRLVHRGLLPSEAGNGSEVKLVKKYRVEDHRRDGVEGLLSIVGVKYTTARDVAEKAIDRALTLLGRPPEPSCSARTPLVGGDIENLPDFVASCSHEGLPAAVMRHLALSYGTRYRRVLEAGDLKPVCAASPVLRAEVRHAVRHEMALDLSSVVLRRTELGTAGHPGRECLETCAEILQDELGWDDERKREEVEAVEQFYRKRT